MNDFQQEWVAVDWGTTHFRVWQMSGADVIEGREASCGLLALQQDQFESTFLSQQNGFTTKRVTFPKL